ncbi:hypothetical protein V502_09892, partial [Pseudogymnoascus sp. VKM F-4520 (FW-2644)]
MVRFAGVDGDGVRDDDVREGGAASAGRARLGRGQVIPRYFCGIEVKREGRRGPRGEDEEDQERAMLLPDDETDDAESEAKPKGKWTFFSSLLPDISPESRAIVVNLCVLIGLDAFASGLVA